MNRFSSFAKSVIPLILALIIQLASTIAIAFITTSNGKYATFSTAMSKLAHSNYIHHANLLYGVIALIIFVPWYLKQFVSKDLKEKRKIPSGFSIHTVLSLLILGFGLQFLAVVIVNKLSDFFTEAVNTYESSMNISGYNLTLKTIVLIYVIILAPIVEETIFRGLIFRCAKNSVGFPIANLWQAALFGVFHLNIAQGVYAFVIGLILGCVVQRGHAIRYSILLHIIFNLLGCIAFTFFSGVAILAPVASIVVIVLLIFFSLWVYYTDFIPEKA